MDTDQLQKFRRSTLRIAAFLAMLAVILGAFGAHWLKNKLGEENSAAWETASRYHFYHALALFLLSLLPLAFPLKDLIRIRTFFLSGILFFSGSLYLMNLARAFSLNAGFLGPLTPLGGIFFILAWLWLGLSVSKTKA